MIKKLLRILSSWTKRNRYKRTGITMTKSTGEVQRQLDEIYEAMGKKS